MDESKKETQKNRILFPSTIKNTPIVVKIGVIAIMTALNATVTVLFAVSIPLSEGGYFNIGESMVYLTAILFGPYIGAIAGGFGSALADIFLSALIFAPGTLIIKGLEGLVVGFVYKKLVQIRHEKEPKKNKNRENLAVIGISLLVSITILLIGFVNFIGEALFFRVLPSTYLFNIKFSYIFWSIIAILSFLTLILMKKFVDPKVTLKIFAMISGGMVILLGYFLYEIPLIGITAAYFEIPFNILQVCVGIVIAIPISGPIKRNLDFFSSS